MVELPRYVKRVRRGARDYYYYQPRRGTANAAKAERVPGDPTDPEFWRWLRARGVAIDAEGSFGALATAWLGSPRFTARADETQRDYRYYLDRMLDRWEDALVVDIDRAAMLEWRRELQDRPTTANHAMAVARSLWRWAVSEGLAQSNPAQGIEPLETSPQQADPWPEWALEAMRSARWELRLFTMLGHYTGQRTRDIVKMTLHDLTPDGIRVVQTKTGKPLLIPVHPDLALIIAEARERGSIVLFPRRKDGRPMRAQDFRAMFYRSAPAPVLAAGLSPHGLCALAHNQLLEVGCSSAEVSSITGRSLQMVERYARQRDQAKLARRAMARWVDSPREDR